MRQVLALKGLVVEARTINIQWDTKLALTPLGRMVVVGITLAALGWVDGGTWSYAGYD